MRWKWMIGFAWAAACSNGCSVDRSQPADPAEVPTASVLGCAAGQVVQWTGDAWACATPPAGRTSFSELGACEVGQVVTGIDAEGRVICADDVDTDTDSLGALGCQDGEVTRWSAVDGWRCDEDEDADTLADVAACPEDGQVLKWGAAGWACGTDDDTDALASVAGCDENGQVLEWTENGWQCGTDDTGTAGLTSITAGTGITLAPDPITVSGAVAVDVDEVEQQVEAMLADRMVPDGCEEGDLLRRTGSTWDCEARRLCPPGFSWAWDGDLLVAFCWRDHHEVRDEMVSVGDFWIDRFEMSECPDSGDLGGPTGGNEIRDGELAGETTTAEACSVGSVQPLGGITWFQAAQLCVNAGKHLCTNAEWQAAASGTPDAGDTTMGEECAVLLGAAADTGDQSDCVSDHGAYDMGGNLMEWVADWYAAPGNDENVLADASNWSETYGGDGTWNISGTAASSSDLHWGERLPAAGVRGGRWIEGARAGVFAFYLNFAPTASDATIGARCCHRGAP